MNMLVAIIIGLITNNAFASDKPVMVDRGVYISGQRNSDREVLEGKAPVVEIAEVSPLTVVKKTSQLCECDSPKELPE